ncbi:MAG: hypothetical protein ACLTW9_08475 [Enterocloster sp.]
MSAAWEEGQILSAGIRWWSLAAKAACTIVFMDPMNYDMGKRPTVIGELERVCGS